MKIEVPALESEPLVYFLFHSGVFVVVLAALFLGLGLTLGWVLWGRYKGRAGSFVLETEAQKLEIADLKRKLAEQALRPLPAISQPPVQASEPPPPVERLLEDLPAMPELAASEFPAKPARTVRPPSRPKPPALAAPARPLRAEAAAIAPFSFLIDEPGREPPDSEA